jgi:hypothetical protein
LEHFHKDGEESGLRRVRVIVLGLLGLFSSVTLPLLSVTNMTLLVVGSPSRSLDRRRGCGVIRPSGGPDAPQQQKTAKPRSTCQHHKPVGIFHRRHLPSTEISKGDAERLLGGLELPYLLIFTGFSEQSLATIQNGELKGSVFSVFTGQNRNLLIKQ